MQATKASLYCELLHNTEVCCMQFLSALGWQSRHVLKCAHSNAVQGSSALYQSDALAVDCCHSYAGRCVNQCTSFIVFVLAGLRGGAASATAGSSIKEHGATADFSHSVAALARFQSNREEVCSDGSMGTSGHWHVLLQDVWHVDCGSKFMWKV